jgi:hypothetical protein
LQYETVASARALASTIVSSAYSGSAECTRGRQTHIRRTSAAAGYSASALVSRAAVGAHNSHWPPPAGLGRRPGCSRAAVHQRRARGRAPFTSPRNVACTATRPAPPPAHAVPR